MQPIRVKWWVAGGLTLSAFLIALGCGSGGSITTDRAALSGDDIAGVVFPGDPTKITEVETQVTRTRTEGAIFNIANIKTTNKAMNLTPERGQLSSRADAIRSPSSIQRG